METFTERRTIQRYKVPGAVVFFAQEKQTKDDERISGDGIVEDFSIKGIRFKTDVKIPGALSLNLVITIPGKEQVFIIGNIVWMSDIQEKDKRIVFVEFRSFGDEPGFNPPQTKTALEKLISELDSNYYL